MEGDKDHEKDMHEEDSAEEDMDNYMDRVGDDSNLKISDIKKLRNDDFLQAVKTFLKEPRNKILEVYVRNLKKNMVLGFLVKTEKILADGPSPRTKEGKFLTLCKEFAFKRNRDEPLLRKFEPS